MKNTDVNSNVATTRLIILMITTITVTVTVTMMLMMRTRVEEEKIVYELFFAVASIEHNIIMMCLD
jgi:hypothetical protein